MIRALGDRLSKNGAITFVSGALSDRPNAYGTAVLGAASAAMEALALELTPTRVNTLSPGITDTPLLGRTFGNGLDAFVSSLKEKLPQYRLVTAAEAGAAVVFLMTIGGMNGEALDIDGGGAAGLSATGRFRAANPRIFGSTLNGDDGEDSDLDLLVDALPGATLFDLGGLQDELKQLLGVRVDLVTPRDLPVKFRDLVLAEAKPV